MFIQGKDLGHFAIHQTIIQHRSMRLSALYKRVDLPFEQVPAHFSVHRLTNLLRSIPSCIHHLFIDMMMYRTQLWAAILLLITIQ